MMEVEPNKSQNVWSKRWEVLLLTCVILAVCALFMIPTIFYALPPFSLIKVVSYKCVTIPLIYAL